MLAIEEIPCKFVNRTQEKCSGSFEGRLFEHLQREAMVTVHTGTTGRNMNMQSKVFSKQFTFLKSPRPDGKNYLIEETQLESSRCKTQKILKSRSEYLRPKDNECNEKSHFEWFKQTDKKLIKLDSEKETKSNKQPEKLIVLTERAENQNK